MRLKYGIALLYKKDNIVVQYLPMSVEGAPPRAELADFLREAGRLGWELCASWPHELPGVKPWMDASGKHVVVGDASEQIQLIFKRAE